jgi:protein-S-isoprenylcysteine O-methyltransferase Ste14
MQRVLSFIYGILAYLVFFVTFLYAIGFISGIGVPKTLDSGATEPALAAIIVNLALMSTFAVQHSVRARRQFKDWWTQFVSPAVERSTYVLASSFALILMFWQWRPLPQTVWHVSDPSAAGIL